MSVDPTKVVFHSKFNSYRNLGVYETTIEIDNSVIPGGTVKSWTSTVTVDPNSTFANVSVQANEFNGGGSATALKWKTFPSADNIYVNLSTDPMGNGNLATSFDFSIDNDQVTFQISVVNPYVADIAFSPTSIGVQYAIHTTD